MAASSLEVRLNHRRIGLITALGGDRSLFSFEVAYAGDSSRPTLSLSFNGDHGGLLRDHNPTQTRLLPFFSNLLPQSSLREYLAKRAGVKAIRESPLIEVLGPELPGSITLKPATGSPGTKTICAARTALAAGTPRGCYDFPSPASSSSSRRWERPATV